MNTHRYHLALALSVLLFLGCPACDRAGEPVTQPGGDVTKPGLSMTLHDAAAKGALDAVRDLASQGADLNAKENGKTPLHVALFHGHEDAAQWLIEHGADVNARDGSGRTPLHYAVWQNQQEIASALLTQGADAQAVDNNGVSVLGAAGYTGGADVSAEAEPGMVVCIDPGKKGGLTVCTTAYDRKAVGIISGAGGIEPGMQLGTGSDTFSGEHPVALTGRVYCYADATFAPIEAGDLLTTSNTPGHAMKAVDLTRAQGAIIGKAMEPLEKGKGLVLVFVTLQ